MKKAMLATITGAVLSSSLVAAQQPPVPSSASTEAPKLTRTVVMTGLQDPWDIAFTPDGVMLFTEKCRGVSARLVDGTTVRLFGTSGSALAAPDLFCQGQSGVHGIAVDPDFPSGARDIYVYMASNLRKPGTNRVVRLTVNADYTSVANRTDIIEDIPYKAAANGAGRAGAHSGGRLRFGPDGFLYVSTGDNHNATLPQDLKRLGGKVLRVNRDGTAAPGNDTPPGGDPRIFTYGHRNVQGISFRPAGQPNAGQPFAAEHGPNHSDEITALVAGGNAGWDPQNRPGLRCPDDYCGYAGDPTTMPMTDTQRFPAAMAPSWVYNGSGRGMGPALFLDGKQWRGWNGRLLVSMMRGLRIVVLELDARGMATSDATVELPEARTRTLVQGPDGNLYTANDAGEVWRVAAEPRRELGAPDVPFVPTPVEVVDAMLKAAKVGEGDVLYDLGSGDGRIPITAARKYGIARGVGVDIVQGSDGRWQRHIAQPSPGTLLQQTRRGRQRFRGNVGVTE